MAEFELDQESVSRAERLSARLMRDLSMVSEQGPRSEMRRELFSERRYANQAEGVPINDVVANVGQMAMEFAMARRWDSEIPCLELADGYLAPISMTGSLVGPMWPTRGAEDLFEFWERHLPFPLHSFWSELLRRSMREDDRVVLTDTREAQAPVERGLKDFLSYRFAGIKKWADWIRGPGTQISGGSKKPPKGPTGGSPPPPSVAPGGGLRVQVSCLTPGLRIHVAPAYFINWVFFGSPTTPVSGYVLPGRYVFAGDGPMLPKRTRDNGVFSIPHSYHPALTRF